MKYFLSENGRIFAYAKDGSEDSFIKPGLVRISDDDANSMINSANVFNGLQKKEILEIAKKEIRAIRRDILDAVTGIGFRASVAEDKELAKEAAAVSQKLLDITDDAALNSAQTYEDMRAAGLKAYLSIEKSVSQGLKSAFNSLPAE